MMFRSSFGRLIVISLGCFLIAGLPVIAAEPLVTGDSTIVRDGVSIALHIPPSMQAPHGPSGILIFFGGKGDQLAHYQKSLTPISDALGMVVVIPHMPWFYQGPKISTATIYRILEQVVVDIEKQFQTDPHWLIIGGASAGGKGANEMAYMLSSKTALYMLCSTGSFFDIKALRTLHVVADSEVAWLGAEGKSGNVLGKGRKDMFAIPGGEHSDQIPHFQVWLKTEMAVLRMERATQTMQEAEEKLRKGNAVQAQQILQSTLASAQALNEPAPDGDAFFQYEIKHRQELLAHYDSTIQSLKKLEAKTAAAIPGASTP
ncbi:MAG: hypothetical protein ABIP97_14400 [Chthoniobacterales bacterium]